MSIKRILSFVLITNVNQLNKLIVVRPHANRLSPKVNLKKSLNVETTEV